MQEHDPKILIINLGGIGDILLSTPALKSLRNLYPRANISMLVVPRVYDLIKNFTFINEVFIFHVGKRDGLPIAGTFRNLKTLLILRKRQFDLAVNMRTLVSKTGALKIKFLLALINPGIKAGRDTEERGRFFDIKIPETDIGQKYEMDYDIDMVTALGGEVTDRNIDFEIDENSLRKIGQILENEGVLLNDILIGINPGGMHSHRWPIENFSEVIERINKRTKCKFVITGGSEETRMADKLIKRTDIRLINMVGKLDIRELGALIKRCNLYISNDTGPMHIAAVLKTPVVAIFGPGDIIRFDPRNISDNAVVLYKKIVCAPCEKVKCKDLKCFKIISNEEVIKAALGLLERKV